ncbi:MAG: LuxR C-terminal-related transcriptional regulator [Bordetella sp.]|uniref:LuxR C-terminal-related transcriptional regulator n=1 Tax=Bordetella sp. TaxID=28081 RepID=UPI003F7B5FD7
MPCSKAASQSAPRLEGLSARERQLVQHYARGLPNKVVAIDFDISERTAEAHRARIFRKMGVRSALELACSICPHRLGSANEV